MGDGHIYLRKSGTHWTPTFDLATEEEADDAWEYLNGGGGGRKAKCSIEDVVRVLAGLRKKGGAVTHKDLCEAVGSDAGLKFRTAKIYVAKALEEGKIKNPNGCYDVA